MKIHKLWLEEWLPMFGVKGALADTLEFINMDVEIDGERQIRVITAAETDEGKVVVFKLVHEPMFHKELIESQIEFSQKLRVAGLNTTYQFKAEGSYVLDVVLEGMNCCLTCEEYIGSRPDHLSAVLEYEIGKVLGESHRLSEKLNLEVGFSRLYHEVMRKSSYRKVWNSTCSEWVDPQWIEQMTEIHDGLMEEIQAEFTSLPKAAVQGDVYGVNNVAVTDEGELAIFDYNLAGDEVLVADFLLSWYRTIGDMNMHTFINEETVDLMWNAFSTGYLKSRPLSKEEYQIGNKLSAVLGLIYLTKLAIELEGCGRVDDAKACLSAGERLLKHPRWLEEK